MSKLFSKEWFDALFAHQEAVLKTRSPCPTCKSEQVQIVDWDVGMWKCRICKSTFINAPLAR